MGKRRNTAKTGDKGIYKSRGSETPSTKDAADNDPMYDEVDRFHNDLDKNFVKLGEDDSSAGSDDATEDEGVFNLATGGDTSSNSSSSEDTDDDDKEGSPDLSSDDESESDENENVRDWGNKKSSYYHGDTADLEIGQEEDDAFLEEEAAKEVQAARYNDMDEADFLLSEEDGDDANISANATVSSTRDVSKLPTRDKQKLLNSQHPELLPLLSHFNPVVEDLTARTSVATEAIFDGDKRTAESIGATQMGQQYLLSKELLQASVALNVTTYLLLKEKQTQDKSENSFIENHPVLLHLQKLNALLSRMDDEIEQQIPTLKEQMDKVVQVAALVNSDDTDSSTGNSDSDEDDDHVASIDTRTTKGEKDDTEIGGGFSSMDSKTATAEHTKEIKQNVLTEARFGLRQSEVISQSRPRKRGRHRSDAGDENIDDDEKKLASFALASTLNSIEQRTNSQKRKALPRIEDQDEHEPDSGNGNANFELLEETPTINFSDDLEAQVGSSKSSRIIDVRNGNADSDDFYAKVSKKSNQRKEYKKTMYAVAPKFPRVESEISGERAINQQIMKNRGLVAHKSKMNRNPRVKKREQYRKAIIRRKGTVRDIRTDEGHKYGGEETGIKTGLSKSRKFGR